MSSGDPFVPGIFSSPCSNRETEEMEELIFFHQLQSKVTYPKQRAQKGGEPGWLLGWDHDTTSVSVDYPRMPLGHKWPSLHLLCKEDVGLGKHVLAFALGPGAGVHWGSAGPAFQEHGVSWETLPFNQDFKPWKTTEQYENHTSSPQKKKREEAYL